MCQTAETDISSMNGRQMQMPVVQRGHEVEVLAAGFLADMEMLSLVTRSLRFGIVLPPHLVCSGDGKHIPDSWANGTAHTCVREACTCCHQPLAIPQPREIQRSSMGFRQT